MNVSKIREQFIFTSEGNNFTEKDALLGDNNLSEKYVISFLRYIIYTTVRSLQAVVGIVGNTLSLIIIGTLRSRTNVHILMIYLAVADIMVSCQCPLAMYIFACETEVYVMSDWETLCIIKMCFEIVVTAGCMLSYTILAVDR